MRQPHCLRQLHHVRKTYISGLFHPATGIVLFSAVFTRQPLCVKQPLCVRQSLLVSHSVRKPTLMIQPHSEVASSSEGVLSYDSNLSYEVASLLSGNWRTFILWGSPISLLASSFEAAFAVRKFHLVSQPMLTFALHCLQTLPFSNGSSLWPMVPHRHACGAWDYFRVCN